MSSAARAAVFLDRDGTLLDEGGYLADPAGLRLLPGAASALRRLNDAGLPVVLVTNQSGVARGLFSENDLARVHAALARSLAREGAHLDGIHYCPHLPPEAGEEPHGPYVQVCDCRKPAPGLYREAARTHGLALERSWAIGDSLRDLEGAQRAGIPNRVLVATGKGTAERARGAPAGLVVHQAPDLAGAVALVLAGSSAAERAPTGRRAGQGR